jgi:hypothetical protein
MLILPPGHAESIRAGRRFSVRERRLIWGVVGLVAVLVVVLVISIGSGEKTSGHGCIYATIPAPTGAQAVTGCGVAARNICATVRAPGAYTAHSEPVVEAACRKAGLAVGP